MARSKKTISFCLALIMFLTAAFVGVFPENALAADQTSGKTAKASDAPEWNRYFYEQLTPDGKVFYEAMYQMYKDGTFMTGTESFELTKGKDPLISQQTAEAYMTGAKPVSLLSVFGAARDAFYADYPDIFYVDFSALSVRATTTKDKNGTTYHIYVGKGRYDNYYTQGYTNKSQVEKAVKEYEAAVEAVVKEAEQVKAGTGEDPVAEKIEFVHDYITENTSYKLEDACKTENIPLIRTAYGSLVKHEAVCEGYSRALKSVLDRLEIPCILVNGVYRHSDDVMELHMWTNVRVNDKWYGVDPTMDDPVPPKSKAKAESTGLDGYENHEYLLASDIKMSQHHSPSAVMSEADYAFEYPMLDIEEFGVKTTEYDNGLVVKYKADGHMEDEDLQAGEFHVSFRGMGYKKAAENGYYIVCRFYQRSEDSDEMEYTDWYYICPEFYESETGDIRDTDTELFMRLPQVEYIEYGVTEVAPREMTVSGYTIPDSTYYGDPFKMVAETGMLHNVTGTYKAPPYPKKCDPIMNGWLDITRTYRISAEFDDTLVPDPDGTEFDIKLSSWKRTPDGEYHYNTAAASRTIFENISFDGKSTVSFDFKASEMWADDNTFYVFQVVGLVGKYSGKNPIEVTYGATYRMAVCAYRSQGYFWNVFAQPTLIENSDLSTEGWETSDGESVSELLKHRMALVVSKPGDDQTDKMNDLIEGEGVDLLASETYNINLTVCKKQVIETGQGVRVCMGFPEGYGPDDEGVTFKVYHFMKDDKGDTVGVEEIPCVVTRYGLLVMCKSFSPYAVAVVKGEPDTAKTVVLSETDGGTITAAGKDSIFTVKKGEKVNITIKANDGFAVDTIVTNAKYELVSGKPGDSTVTISVSADDLASGSSIIEAQFASKTVKEEEQSGGETVALPQAQPPKVTLSEEKIVLSQGDKLVIDAEVSEGENSYQWFKDGVALVGQTTARLEIDKVTADDAGVYTLQVTSVAGATSALMVSANSCEVVIAEEHIHTFGEWVTHSSSCTANGFESRSCTVCGYTEERGLDLADHQWEDSFTVDKAPTCTEYGSRSIHCKNCDAVEESELILPLGHSFDQWETVKKANCTTKGEQQRVCSVCGEKETRETEMTDHNFVDGVCTVCGTKQNNGSEERPAPTPSEPSQQEKPDNGGTDNGSSGSAEDQGSEDNAPDTGNSRGYLRLVLLGTGCVMLAYSAKSRNKKK